MKTSNVLKLGIRDIRKHPITFLLNCVVIGIMMLFIFFCVNTIASIKASNIASIRNKIENNNKEISISVFNQSVTTNEQDIDNIFASLMPNISKYGQAELELNKMQDGQGNEQIVSANIKVYLTDQAISNIEKLDKELSQLLKRTGATYTNYVMSSSIHNDIEKVQAYNYIFVAVGCIIVGYITLLILVILKNNAMINVFDKIRFYAILTCQGMSINNLVCIAMVESTLIVSIGLVGGALLNVFLSVPVGMLGSLIAQSCSFDIGVSIFRYVWYMPIIYLFLCVGIVGVYLYIEMSKNLKRKNLLGTLRRE